MIISKPNNDGDEKKYKKLFNRIALPIAATVALGTAYGMYEMFNSVGAFSSYSDLVLDSLTGVMIAATSAFTGGLTAMFGDHVAKNSAGYTSTSLNTEEASEGELKTFFETDDMDTIKEAIEDIKQGRQAQNANIAMLNTITVLNTLNTINTMNTINMR